MPGSYPKFKREVAAHVRAVIGSDMRVVDVGPGAGIWADLLGHGRLDAIEVHAPYVDEYGLRQKYQRVIVEDVRRVDLMVSAGGNLPHATVRAWNYVIMGDVLEHLHVADAQHIVREATRWSIKLLVAVPYLAPQEPTNGNEHERHIQADLTPAVMAERYPELRLLIGDDSYGYFVNYDAEPLVADPVQPAIPMPVDVFWYGGGRGFWDHGLLMHAFEGRLWPTPQPFVYREHTDIERVSNRGCVAVVPARHFVREAEGVRSFIDRRSWTLALLVSDEESEFPWQKAAGPTSQVWAQTPSPRHHGNPPRIRRPMILGWRGDTRATGAALSMPPARRSRLWSFSGQENNPKRSECIATLRGLADGELQVTGGFGQGDDYPTYLQRLADTCLVPSPSGSFTPDCFRTWEALEVGALPVADAHSPKQHYPGDYYAYALGCEPDEVPFPRVESWRDFPAIVERYRDDRLQLQVDTNRAGAWWMRRKRQFVLNLENDIHETSGLHTEALDDSLRHLVTIIMPTSPVPSHPSTAMIEASIARIRAYPELAQCEVLICVDGVHPRLEHRRAEYVEYTRQLIWRCNWAPELFGCLPLVFDAHTHQAGMTARALDLVRTPLVLFVEHDTWPCGDIDWRRLARVVEAGVGGLRVARLQHYGGDIHPEHRHLLFDGDRRDFGGVPMYRTRQWSQRPHLARADFYRGLMRDYFGPRDRTMIEDVMVGPSEAAPWERFGIGVYAPAGDMKRSETCDGRGSDPKIEIDFREGR